MRIVIDTDVLLSGLRSPGGASRIILIGVFEAVVTPLVNVAILLEYEAVLKRPANLALTGLAHSDVDRSLDDGARLAEPAIRGDAGRPRVIDPDDAMFAEAAVVGLADAPVTFNISDYRLIEPAGGRLPVEVLRPGEFLRRLAWRPTAISLSAFLRA